MFSSRTKLFLTRHIYDHSRTETFFNQALHETIETHRQISGRYRKLYDDYAADEGYDAVNQQMDLHKILPIPTLYFKRNNLLDTGAENTDLEVTSSGTAGAESRMRFKRGDLVYGVGMMIRFFKHHKILSPIPTHYIILGYKPDTQNARGAVKTAYYSTKFAPALSRTYALKRVGDSYEVDFVSLKEALQKYAKGLFPIRFVGFPSYMHFLLESLAAHEVKLRLPKHSKVLLGGGWKNHAQTSIEPELLQHMIVSTLGIPKHQCHEFFSAVEHPLPYHKCEAGAFHIPAYSRVLARNAKTLEPLNEGELGLLNFISPLVTGTPVASVITDDLGTVYPENTCTCGNPSPYFKLSGRAGVAEIKTCTVEAAEHMTATQVSHHRTGESFDMEALRREIYRTYEAGALTSEMVIAACERLAAALDEDMLVIQLTDLGYSREKALREVHMAKTHLTRKHLEDKVVRELGDANDWKPMGTLFHIPAGNVDALPFFSVLEGLLVGNVNLLKSPLTDGGLTELVFEKLIEVEPKIKPYVYIFDVPSTDVATIEKLIALSNAVVIWGGDQAIVALRQLVPPQVKLIEWGHKLSFAYLSAGMVTCFINRQNASDAQQINAAFDEIAYNMCDTDQLYCNSAQGIYVDSADMTLITEMGAYYLERFKQMAHTHKRELPLGILAQTTLACCTEQLESVTQEKTFFGAQGVSVTVKSDSALETSIQFRNCWMKPLPTDQLIRTLAPHKEHLQTMGLACLPHEQQMLSERLLTAGLVRIKTPKQMSELNLAEPHDGEYPLRLYTKRVVDLS